MVQNHPLLADSQAHLQYTRIYAERKPQVAYWFTRGYGSRSLWMGVRNTIGQYAWSWSLFIFAISFGVFHAFYDPLIALYKYNNQNVIPLTSREPTP